MSNYFGDQIEKNGMDGACGVYGGQERCMQGLVGRPGVKRPIARLVVGERIILKWIFKKWGGEAWTGWIWLRIETSCGRVLNAVMKFRVP